MMTLSERITAFAAVGEKLANLSPDQKEELAFRASNENNWFTREYVFKAIEGIIHYLQHDQLVQWTAQYPINQVPSKKVGLIMAGNIPAVGFHDFLSVLICGHHLHGKLSSKDTVLLKFTTQLLLEAEPRFQALISFQEFLKKMEAYIGTGSNNSARYFEYYFRSYPSIIRKNRTSVAILTGTETEAELKLLANDALDYFGLGCRNVTKLYAPKHYDWTPLLQAWEDKTQSVASNHKYHNNYDYHKAILLVNQEAHLDNGGLLLRESESLFTPVSCIHHQSYDQPEQLEEILAAHADQIQCIVSKTTLKHHHTIAPGQAQKPGLSDYSDGVDTMQFLSSLQ